MNTNKKPNSVKPHLFIEIHDRSESREGQKEVACRNEVALKPLRSAKNLHELRKFNFQNENLQQVNTGRQLNQLRKLQEQKINLMKSLQILKASAVSAIAEKVDEIEMLREREDYEQEQQFYQLQLQRGKKIRIELEQQREQLHRQMHMERKRYIAELEQKQQLIDDLYNEIQNIRRELSLLQEYNFAKTKKIKLLQEQNSKLSDQLEISSITTTVRDKTQIKNEIVIDFDETIRGETIKLQPALSVTSQIPNRSYVSYVESDHCFQSEAERSYLTEKLEEVERAHKDQLLDLKSFYEKRIQGLREIYERQLNLQTEESEKVTVRSRKNSQSSTPGMQKTPSRKQLDSNLNLNLKDMYSIEESVENQLQTSRSKMLSLRHDIKMQNLSECPSLEPRMFTINDDAESQFTTKYFEVPSRFLLKRNRSNDTFNTIPEQDSKTIIKTSTTIEEKGYKNEKIMSNQGSFFRKSCIFAAGLISGATITSVLGYLLKKN